MSRGRKINLKVHFIETGYIAFLLLVFFVIFISINTNKPVGRNIISLEDSGVPQISDVKPRNILKMKLDKNNRLSVDGERVTVDQLNSIVKEFIDNPDNESNKPEKGWRNISFFGPMLITLQHVIYFEYSKQSSFGAYIDVRKRLKNAYVELCDELAEKKWQKKFKTLLPNEQKAVLMIYPQQIVETIY
jgi:hypothetical protein